MCIRDSTEADKCVACGRGVEVCPAGAVKLGQKLRAASTGKVPEYPKQELPDAVKWGPEKWSPDYRNKNRIETYDTGTSPCKTCLLYTSCRSRERKHVGTCESVGYVSENGAPISVCAYGGRNCRGNRGGQQPQATLSFASVGAVW